MALMDVAQALMGHIEAGTTRQGLDELYAPDAVSVEAAAPDGNRVTEGREGIKGKHDWWDANFKVHSASTEGPFPHGEEAFALIFSMDAEQLSDGMRWEMREVGVYHVKDDKIVREEFFYRMG